MDALGSARSPGIIDPDERLPMRLAIDLDVVWEAPVLGRMSVRHPPVHAPDAAALARAIVARPGFRLVGLMAHEAQI